MITLWGAFTTAVDWWWGLQVIRCSSRSTLHAGAVAFYVYPIPLQRIGPFSRVKSPYIIQQIIPPPQPRPTPTPATKTFRCKLISTLPDTLRLCLPQELSAELSRFHCAAFTNMWRYSAWGWQTLGTRRLTPKKKKVKESKRKVKR